ncbi:MAG: flap endonuclease-1 [Candidatus Diapherotrites archaeon]|nr:flap endonuclease-1 [Candidatus Diapherotrites archaeon]
MGVNLGELLPGKSIELEHLTGRSIAVDAYNTLYQFLSIIRQPDGTPLMNSRGETTSHLAGLLYRTSNLVALGIRPAFVFDGVPPEKKAETIAARVEVRRKAKEKWDDALERGAVEEARTYAQQATRLTKEMVVQANELLAALGIPSVQAPQEGEAQAAFMCAEGDVWAAGSQDFDALLFGSPRLLRNMTITGRRKLPRKNIYIMVKPELIEMEECELTRGQLLEIALMMGTDFNEGVKGIGPKKALAAIKGGKTADDVHREAGLEGDLTAVRDIFLHPETTKGYKLEWRGPDEEKALKLLVDRHEFSESRVKSSLAKMREALSSKGTQSRLDVWS